MPRYPKENSLLLFGVFDEVEQINFHQVRSISKCVAVELRSRGRLISSVRTPLYFGSFLTMSNV